MELPKSLTEGWEIAIGSRDAWQPVKRFGTVATALGLTVDDAKDLDALEVWYRKKLAPNETGDLLRFGGLATICDVNVDGGEVVRSENMFLEHEIAVHDPKEIELHFAPLAKALTERRPRPRWKATIVAQQQLRWFRTSLLGRIPAWTPHIAPVGPWRPITLEKAGPIASHDVRAYVDGRDGIVEAEITVRDGAKSIELVVGEHHCVLFVENDVARGKLRIPNVPLWFPHTHGAQPLFSVSAAGVKLGVTGFRKLDVDREDGAFTLFINGVRTFARGACWMPLDPVTLSATRDQLRSALMQVRDAGMNMVRLSGTMVYESRDFHELCDELGILVWQDFMFANMDYPIADEKFAASVRREAKEVMQRLSMSPSLVVCCGGSEVEQQAAMMGLPEKDWSSPLFRDVLPSFVRKDVAYVPSSPSSPDGVLPFRVDRGVSHYYGVGAYLRPFEDARRARVRFTSECLAFANVPCDETIEALMRDGESPPLHPRWKARVPRDRGTPWDFDDVRDHYVKRIFGVDPAVLRYADLARYLELGRVAVAECMSAAIGEWRTNDECAGAIVWFLRDLWNGAGWGVVDARGVPKSAYYAMKRVCAPVALLATDEGLNGLRLHAMNDRAEPIEGAELRVALHRGEHVVAEGKRAITIGAHGSTSIGADEIVGRFTDVTYAYRFGPPAHDATIATLVSGSGDALGRAFHFPRGLGDERVADLGVEASAVRIDERSWRLTVRAKKTAHAVAIDARGFVAADDFFHVAAGGEHVTELTGQAATLSGTVRALNASNPIKIAVAR
jgi:beta-mannosidase